MSFRKSQLQTSKKTSKLALGLAVVGATALVGSAGAVGATSNANMGSNASASSCKSGGWKQLGFRNQGTCVSAMGKAAKHNGNGSNGSSQNGSGYGGNNNVSTDVNLSINGDNNVVSLIINYFLGQ